VISKHVILISIDGLRADAIEAAGARTLLRLMGSGSATLDAQTTQPSRTLPSHTSMLTGVTPDIHGITWNSDRTDELGTVSVPTVFELAHQAGYHTAAFFSKSKFNHLVREGSLDEVGVPNGGVLSAARTVREAVRYMRHERPNLLFVHIADPDFMGHRVGWMSTLYRWAVREADAGVAEILEAAERTYGEGNFTVIVTADHGGHGRDHGTEDVADTTIPWISWGQGIRPDHHIAGDVHTVDTAATVLRVLGVAIPEQWMGVPVGEALAAPLTAVALDGQPQG
jgi:predicted AlkP superfamily pyrophosphatase or phosphodiesterase